MGQNRSSSTSSKWGPFELQVSTSELKRTLESSAQDQRIGENVVNRDEFVANATVEGVHDHGIGRVSSHTVQCDAAVLVVV